MFDLLEIFLLLFHSSLILFNLLGWIWKKTRKLNLITLSLTGLSWVGLGVFFGWGYCFLTDWHWSILEKLGETNLSGSYVQYLIIRVFRMQISENLADYLTGILFLIALILSIYFNFRNKVKP